MTYLSEDPTYPVVGLVLLAGAMLAALYATQQGKYLIRAGVILALAAAVLVVEWLWVTDTERIEQAVDEIRQSVLSSDADRLLTHLTTDVQYAAGGRGLSGGETRALIRASLGRAHFDVVRVSGLRTSAGQQSRRGTAEFQVFTTGTMNLQTGMSDSGTALTSWSLGFQETEPGVWKVNRITPISSARGTVPQLPGF